MNPVFSSQSLTVEEEKLASAESPGFSEYHEGRVKYAGIGSPSPVLTLTEWEVVSGNDRFQLHGWLEKRNSSEKGKEIWTGRLFAQTRGLFLSGCGSLYRLGRPASNKMSDLIRYKRELESIPVLLKPKSPPVPVPTAMVRVHICDGNFRLVNELEDQFDREHFHLEVTHEAVEAVHSVRSGSCDVLLVRAFGREAQGRPILDMLSALRGLRMVPLIVLESLRRWPAQWNGYENSNLEWFTRHDADSDPFCRPGMISQQDNSVFRQELVSMVESVGCKGSLMKGLGVDGYLCVENESGGPENADFRFDLSDREVSVAYRRGSGMSCKEIAQDLNMSVHTVYTHTRNIARKVRALAH
jgi:hypothetical protein